MNKLRVFEMFAGYGGASFGLKKTGIDFECVGFSEINKYAHQCYIQNHVEGNSLKDIIPNFGDCTKIDPRKLPDFDLLTGGFPCQSFSRAGNCLGELDTRGTLFNEIIRIAEVKKPKYMLLENVRDLLAKRHESTFNKILSELNRIGYNVKWKVLNSKEHGIPQSRQRLFFVCFRGDIIEEYVNFDFPEKEELKFFLKDILECGVCDRDISYCLDANYFKGTNVKSYLDKKRRQIVFHIKGKGEIEIEENRAYMIGNLTRYNMKSVRVPYAKIPGIAWALGTSINQAIYFEGYFRKLTPKECFRLMGFLDDEINLEGISNSQCYKLAGNGWDINLVSKIFKKMFK